MAGMEELSEPNAGGRESTERSRARSEVLLSHVDMLYAVAMRYTGNEEAARGLAEDALRVAFEVDDSEEAAENVKMGLLQNLRRIFVQKYCMRSMMDLHPQT